MSERYRITDACLRARAPRSCLLRGDDNQMNCYPPWSIKFFFPFGMPLTLLIRCGRRLLNGLSWSIFSNASNTHDRITRIAPRLCPPPRRRHLVAASAGLIRLTPDGCRLPRNRLSRIAHTPPSRCLLRISPTTQAQVPLPTYILG